MLLNTQQSASATTTTNKPRASPKTNPKTLLRPDAIVLLLATLSNSFANNQTASLIRINITIIANTIDKNSATSFTPKESSVLPNSVIVPSFPTVLVRISENHLLILSKLFKNFATGFAVKIAIVSATPEEISASSESNNPLHSPIIAKTANIAINTMSIQFINLPLIHTYYLKYNTTKFTLCH